MKFTFIDCSTKETKSASCSTSNQQNRYKHSIIHVSQLTYKFFHTYYSDNGTDLYSPCDNVDSYDGYKQWSM